MKINFLLFFIVFTCTSLMAQRNLLNQKYITLAEDFKIENAQLEDYHSQGKVEVFNVIKHKTRLAKKLQTPSLARKRLLKAIIIKPIMKSLVYKKFHITEYVTYSSTKIILKLWKLLKTTSIK